MAYIRNVEHIVVPVDCEIVMANKKWVEPRKMLLQQPRPNKVKAMIKQLEKMTLAEKVRATTLLAWRWPSAWTKVRETMWAEELKVKEKTRQAALRAAAKAKKAVLNPEAVAKGNGKFAAVRRPRAKAKSIFAPMAVLKPKAVAKGKAKAAAVRRPRAKAEGICDPMFMPVRLNDGDCRSPGGQMADACSCFELW